MKYTFDDICSKYMIEKNINNFKIEYGISIKGNSIVQNLKKWMIKILVKLSIPIIEAQDRINEQNARLIERLYFILTKDRERILLLEKEVKELKMKLRDRH